MTRPESTVANSHLMILFYIYGDQMIQTYPVFFH